LIGARIAAQDADAHRYRFLDIRRELSRLHSPSLASPSVAASRNPFLPDASFLAPSASSPARVAAMTIGRREAAVRVAYPRGTCIGLTNRRTQRERTGGIRSKNRGDTRRGPMGRAGDMYTNGVAKPASGARGAAATDLSATASPESRPASRFWSIENGSPGAKPRVRTREILEEDWRAGSARRPWRLGFLKVSGSTSMEAKQMNQGIRVGAGLTRKQQETRQRLVGSVLWMMVGCLVVAIAPELAFAGSSPFTTGATAASTNLLAILTPIAVVAVMALGAAAWFNKISWGWAVAGIVGICLVFGAQQIVTWIRGMFGV